MHDNTRIRIMTPDDYEGALACWMACEGMGLNTTDDSPEGIAKFLVRNPNTCFVAEINRHIVGAILTGHDGRRGYIYHTAVHPDHHNQGIGGTLVDAALRALADEGIIKVALVVFARNEAGNAFWQHLGFTSRDDLTYRNKALAGITRIDT